MNYGDPAGPMNDHGLTPNSNDPLGTGQPSLPLRPAARASVPPSATGSASVGRANVARAAVPGSSGRAVVPAASGRAALPSGRASVPNADSGRPAGRAVVASASVGSVPLAGAAGRASVGRASVGADVPAGVRPDGSGPGAPDADGAGRRGRRPRSKKARLRNWIIAGVAAVIMLAGTTLVGGTFFFASVATPEELKLPESTQVLYSDGKTPMAKIGVENRTIVPITDIPIYVQHAVIATEDRSFYTNKGIDMKGIFRAAWNNFTGGDRQGASTITQQYARQVEEDLSGISYTRKLREAAIAMKLNDKYSKEQILGFYLNAVYFGRGAYGVEAAAQAYFHKPVKELSVEQGIVLAGLIKQPDSAGGKGSPYDNSINPELANARWVSIRDAMITVKPMLNKHGGEKYQVTKEMQPPKVEPIDPNSDEFNAQYGLDKATGHVVHQVMAEIAQIQKTDKNLAKYDKMKSAGLKIITSIDPSSQAVAEKYANRASKDSPLYGQAEHLVGALVAVEPYTGRVIAYYGGANGKDIDFAGTFQDPFLGSGSGLNAYGFHPPGSTFKIYTLAAGLRAGISVNSYWDGRDKQQLKGRAPGNPVSNVGGDGECGEHCPLWQATEYSLNTPFYSLAVEIGADKVLEFARAAGIRYMQANSGKIIDLNSGTATEVANNFGYEIGFGQYAVSVMDHANGVATLAARGNTAKVHFIKEIWKTGAKIYVEALKKQKVFSNFTDQMADNEAWVLQKIAKRNDWDLANNRQFAAKTGTWQFSDKRSTENGHSWTVGYVAPKLDSDPNKSYLGLAGAAWVGSKDKDPQPLKLKNGNKIYGYNGGGAILSKFMAEVTKGKPVGTFPQSGFVGDDDRGNGTSPTPSAPPPDRDDDDDNNNGNGNGQPGTLPGQSASTGRRP